MRFSLDGGVNYVYFPGNIRIVHDLEDEKALNINFTDEGLILDVVEDGEIMSSFSQTYTELEELCQ